MRTLGHFIREALISFTVVSLVFLTIITVTEENGYAHVAESASSFKCGSSQCESIRNPDRRHYCRAISIPRRTECESIKDRDLRHMCRAMVK